METQKYQLKWTKCLCGYPSCQIEQPDIGSFYQGSGFNPAERALIDRAFAALATLEAVPAPATDKLKPTDFPIGQRVAFYPGPRSRQKVRGTVVGHMEHHVIVEFVVEGQKQTRKKSPGAVTRLVTPEGT